MSLASLGPAVNWAGTVSVVVVIRVVRVPEVVTLVDKIPADGFLRKLTRSSSDDFGLDADFTVAFEDRSDERRVVLPRHVGL